MPILSPRRIEFDCKALIITLARSNFGLPYNHKSSIAGLNYARWVHWYSCSGTDSSAPLNYSILVDFNDNGVIFKIMLNFRQKYAPSIYGSFDIFWGDIVAIIQFQGPTHPSSSLNKSHYCFII